MKGFLMFTLVIAAIVVMCLFIVRMFTVPSDVKNALGTDSGVQINRMTQIPTAVRKKMEQSNRIADSNMSGALKSVDRNPDEKL